MANDEVIWWNRIKGGQGTIMQRTAGFVAVVWLVCGGLMLPQAVGQDTEWQGPRPAPQVPLSQPAPQVLELPPQQPQPAPQGHQAPVRPQHLHVPQQPDSALSSREQHRRWCYEQFRRLEQQTVDQALRQRARILRLEEQERQASQDHMTYHAWYGGYPSDACWWEQWHARQVEQAYRRLNEQALRAQAEQAWHEQALRRQCP